MPHYPGARERQKLADAHRRRVKDLQADNEVAYAMNRVIMAGIKANLEEILACQAQIKALEKGG